MYRLTPSDFAVLYNHISQAEFVWDLNSAALLNVEEYVEYLFTHNWRNSNLNQLRDDYFKTKSTSYEPASTY